MQKKTIIKVVVSVGLILFLVNKVSLPTLISALKSVHFKVLSLSFGLLLVQQAIMILSWGVILRGREKEVPFRAVAYAHFVGNFFGTLLPSAVGMDAIRAFYLSKHVKQGVHAVTSLVICRAMGFIVLFSIALIIAIPMSKKAGNINMIFSIGIVFLLFLIGMFFIYHPFLYKVSVSILTRLRAQSFAEKIMQFRESLVSLSRQHQVLWRVVILTIIFQILGILVVYLLGLALEIQADLVYYFLFVPLAIIVSLLPISLGGIGVREASFVYLFSMVGVAEAQGFSLSLFVFVQSIFLAILGGLVYWIQGLQKKVAVKSGCS